MRPNAINTCCPAGVQPTVYGINNGRSINITPETANLSISWKTKNTSGVINEDEIDVNTKNTSVNVQSNLTGSNSATWSPTSNLGLISGTVSGAVTVVANDEGAQACAAQMQATDCTIYKTKNARKKCEKDRGDVRKECDKANADARKAEEKAKVGLTLSNWVDCRDYNLYCCQEWNRFEWECITQDLPASSTSCTDVVSAAHSAGITADNPGTCVSQTASLANTLVNVEKSPNTTCISGCGTTHEVNVETRGNSCQSSNYRYDEGPTGSQCNNDCACDNTRTCSAWGWCQY